MSDTEKYYITTGINNYWPKWLRDAVRKQFPAIERLEFNENENGLAFDCTGMNRHEYRAMVELAYDYCAYYNRKEGDANPDFEPFEFYGQIVEKWPQDKRRARDLKDLREAAEKLQKEEDELKAKKMPTHGMHPATKDDVAFKHDLSLSYSKEDTLAVSRPPSH